MSRLFNYSTPMLRRLNQRFSRRKPLNRHRKIPLKEQMVKFPFLNRKNSKTRRSSSSHHQRSSSGISSLSARRRCSEEEKNVHCISCKYIHKSASKPPKSFISNNYFTYRTKNKSTKLSFHMLPVPDILFL